MTTQRQLLKKLTTALRSAGVTRYAHHMGPHTYTTAELVLGLAIREAYRLSYRGAAAFLDEYYALRLHWTTLQKAASRLPAALWHGILRSTAPDWSPVAAVDATGYARSAPSAHYLRRIDGVMPAVPIKLSILVDVETRRVLSARARVRPAHETRDVHGLITRSPSVPWVMLGDKAYDAEPLHEWLDARGVRSIVPPRARCCKGRHRLRLRDRFPDEEYPERNIVEAVFHALKARFGGHVRGRTARTVRAELFLRLVLHNFLVRLVETFYRPKVTNNLIYLFYRETEGVGWTPRRYG